MIQINDLDINVYGLASKFANNTKWVELRTVSRAVKVYSGVSISYRYGWKNGRGNFIQANEMLHFGRSNV